MALDGVLHKLVFGGKLAQTESWSCSLHFITPTIPATNPQNFGAAVSAWFTRMDSNIADWANLEYLKINAVDPVTGDYLSQTESNTYFWVTPPVGQAPKVVPHATLVCSWVTGVVRGPASKGRMYPPSGGLWAIGADGRTTTAAALAQSASHAQLITDLNGSAGGECYIWSQVHQVQQEIIGARVGRVYDTQQRRRKNLIEDYQYTGVS